MRLVLIPLAAAVLFAGQALAQDDHAGHHPAADAKTAAPAAGGMGGMSQADTHKMCASTMGKGMAPKAVHEHSREKNGMAMWPNGKPLSKTEMAAMHKKCAAMMKDEPAAAAK